MCARKRAAAKDDRADRARGGGIVDAHETAAGFFVDGHFGDDGDAHSGAYHAEEAAELAAFEDDLRVETRAVASGDGGVAEAVAISQQQKRLGAQVF